MGYRYFLSGDTKYIVNIIKKPEKNVNCMICSIVITCCRHVLSDQKRHSTT